MNENNNTFFQLENISKNFYIKKGIFKNTLLTLKAIENVSLEVGHGKTLGLVGESGCGKTTVARIMLRLEKPTSGKILYEGNNVNSYNKNDLFIYRKNIQMIFQDPYSSLNPQHNIKNILCEPLKIHKMDYNLEKIYELLDLVNLPKSILKKYPHELSGGLRQRVGIAKALTLEPKLIVCDEPVSALDVSIRSQITNLLIDLQSKKNISYLFISHDLSLVEHLSDNIAIMYLGQIVEYISSKDFRKNHIHPYTKALISSIPNLNLDQKVIEYPVYGEVPSAIAPPKGCNFNTRCPKAIDICYSQEPKSKKIKNDHYAACHLV